MPGWRGRRQGKGEAAPSPPSPSLTLRPCLILPTTSCRQMERVLAVEAVLPCQQGEGEAPTAAATEQAVLQAAATTGTVPSLEAAVQAGRAH